MHISNVNSSAVKPGNPSSVIMQGCPCFCFYKKSPKATEPSFCILKVSLPVESTGKTLRTSVCVFLPAFLVLQGFKYIVYSLLNAYI